MTPQETALTFILLYGGIFVIGLLIYLQQKYRNK